MHVSICLVWAWAYVRVCPYDTGIAHSQTVTFWWLCSDNFARVFPIRPLLNFVEFHQKIFRMDGGSLPLHISAQLKIYKIKFSQIMTKIINITVKILVKIKCGADKKYKFSQIIQLICVPPQIMHA